MFYEYFPIPRYLCFQNEYRFLNRPYIILFRRAQLDCSATLIFLLSPAFIVHSLQRYIFNRLVRVSRMTRHIPRTVRERYQWRRIRRNQTPGSLRRGGGLVQNFLPRGSLVSCVTDRQRLSFMEIIRLLLTCVKSTNEIAVFRTAHVVPDHRPLRFDIRSVVKNDINVVSVDVLRKTYTVNEFQKSYFLRPINEKLEMPYVLFFGIKTVVTFETITRASRQFKFRQKGLFATPRGVLISKAQQRCRRTGRSDLSSPLTHGTGHDRRIDNSGFRLYMFVIVFSRSEKVRLCHFLFRLFVV